MLDHVKGPLGANCRLVLKFVTVAGSLPAFGTLQFAPVAAARVRQVLMAMWCEATRMLDEEASALRLLARKQSLTSGA